MDWIAVAIAVAVFVSNVCWFVAYRQIEKTLQRALENGESWERLYHVASESRIWLKYQDMADDAVVFED